MNKILMLLVVAVMALSFSSAFAATTNYYDFNTTGGAFNLTNQTLFTTADQPYLFVRFTNASVNATPSSENRWLISKDGMNITRSLNYNGTTNGFWLPLQQWFNDSYWGNVSRIGNWTISSVYSNVSYSLGGLANFSGTCGFQVKAVPEPISATLFLVGGAGLAMVRRKKS